jgi:hypothetical protein
MDGFCCCSSLLLLADLPLVTGGLGFSGRLPCAEGMKLNISYKTGQREGSFHQNKVPHCKAFLRRGVPCTEGMKLSNSCKKGREKGRLHRHKVPPVQCLLREVAMLRVDAASHLCCEGRV